LALTFSKKAAIAPAAQQQLLLMDEVKRRPSNKKLPFEDAIEGKDGNVEK